MRIWHEELIPKLCQKHLCAMWREGLGCYKIVTCQVSGGSYKNHPAVKEFENDTIELIRRLCLVREEMLSRGYNPKELKLDNIFTSSEVFKPWQTLEEQIEIIKKKGCKCKI